MWNSTHRAICNNVVDFTEGKYQWQSIPSCCSSTTMQIIKSELQEVFVLCLQVSSALGILNCCTVLVQVMQLLLIASNICPATVGRTSANRQSSHMFNWAFNKPTQCVRWCIDWPIILFLASCTYSLHFARTRLSGQSSVYVIVSAFQEQLFVTHPQT